MILIDTQACNRDFTVPSIFGDTVLQNGVVTYKTAESTLFAIPVVDLSKEKNKSFVINEPQHELSNDVVYATSKVSDQPAHTRSLIRAFLVAWTKNDC